MVDKKLKIAVVGVGHHGQYHVDKLVTLPQAELVAVCDTNLQVCKELANKHAIAAVQDYRELASQVDAVSIVVPTSLHHKITKFFLENNIHVLLEKPITTTVAEADELIALAKKQQRVLQIGHLERFNAAVIALDGVLNKPRFIESYRIAPFSLRGTDVNVILDLLIHDIDIVQNIVKSPIKNIDASGTTVLTDHIDMINARVRFENNCVANMVASRVSTRKQRIMRIFQPDTYINIDFHEKRISIHSKGEGQMFPGVPGIPEIIRSEQTFEQGDALLAEIASFIDAVLNHKTPKVTGEDGKQALRTALAITDLVHKECESIQKQEHILQS